MEGRRIEVTGREEDEKLLGPGASAMDEVFSETRNYIDRLVGIGTAAPSPAVVMAIRDTRELIHTHTPQKTTLALAKELLEMFGSASSI
jgi:hypothetical protein